MDDEDYQDWSSEDGEEPGAGGAALSIFQRPYIQEENSSSDDEGEESVLDWTQRFPQLLVSIQGAVSELGGQVVPKLNWSCPSDATWVNPMSSLSCSNAEQVREDQKEHTHVRG